MIEGDFSVNIDKASKVIGKTWPLYSFVTSNPLSGYENLHFKDALFSAKNYLNANVLPQPKIFKQVLNTGEIDTKILSSFLTENNFNETPEFYLSQMENESAAELNTTHNLDRIMAKWLAAFMDEGLAEWQMPGKKEGFYKAWLQLAKYDQSLNIKKNSDIPKSSKEALSEILKDYPNTEHLEIFTQHLAALPGWTGYINHRNEPESAWQKEYPITLEDYLGVRLWIAKNLKIGLLKKAAETISKKDLDLRYIWLKAWERSWQKNIVETLDDVSTAEITQVLPEAQLVFCIDTRSELIRRHVEVQGNYETYGYAGFFGIAMDYTNLEDNITKKSCPPIVTSSYQVSERVKFGLEEKMTVFKKKNEISKFQDYFLIRMKNMLPSTFGFVEGAGLFYGISLFRRTLFLGFLYRFENNRKTSFEKFATPQISSKKAITENEDIPLADKVAIVKSAFDLTGWRKFAPLVIFVGHGSHSANNPFASSLDCGACAANPGRHNARMFAKLANLKEVREVLSSDYNLRIPNDTVFIGAEHNTTTDEIKIFDSELPASHKEQLNKLKENLKNAQKTATKERLGSINSVSLAQNKANDWAETRPEWGLAKNAGFIVAQRNLTKSKNLNSRCFLHSYDWKEDLSGRDLECIMQGPMVVTQWINNHYYFSTVDNKTFGGGSKITHNITGRFGVLQGNGGDLKMGLPLQSINETDSEIYHQPLRLSVIINAPITVIIDILSRNKNLKALLDNEWIYLMVIDPRDHNKVKTYSEGRFVL